MAQKAGFCFGVTRVVRLIGEALDTSRREGKTIYGLGWPIHNTALVNSLQRQGLRIISSLDEITDLSRAVLVIRAHGEQQPVLDRAAALGIEIWDATCPLVARIRQKVAAEAAKGRAIICIGSAGHPEVQGILSCSSQPAVAFLAEGAMPDWPEDRPVAVVTQSTITQKTYAAAMARLSSRFRDLSCYDLRCSAVEMRQNEALELSAKVDLMLVVGSRVSANSCHLTDLCRSRVTTWQLESADDLPELPPGVLSIGITAGSSTPPESIAAIVEKIKNL